MNFSLKQVKSNDIELNIAVSICYVNYRIIWSKCPSLAVTHACSRCSSLSQCCQWPSPVRQTTSTEVHFKIG